MSRFEQHLGGQRFTYALAAVLLLLWSLLGMGWLPSVSPLLAMGSALLAFLTPGYVLSLWVLRDRAIGLMERIPFALALSVGLLAPLAILMKRNLSQFSAFVLVMAGGFLIVGVVLARRGGKASHNPSTPLVRSGLAILMLIAGSITALGPRDYDDWIYLGWITRLLHAPETLWADTRFEASAWFVYEATLSHLSGLDPVNVVQITLPPLLAALGVLSFYGLCLDLCGSRRLAFWATAVQMALYVTEVEPTLGFGRVFFTRIGQDKVAAAFVLLPVAFRMAIWAGTRLTRREVIALALVLAGLLGTHIIGIALFVFIAGPFLALRFLPSWHEHSASGWQRLLVWIPLLVLIPAAWWLRTAVVAQRIWFALENLSPAQVLQFSGRRLLFLSDTVYIMPLHLLAHPLKVLTILCLPYLIWVGRRRSIFQFLAISLLIPLFTLYNPWTMAVFGAAVGPIYVWRFLWFLPVGPVLVLTVRHLCSWAGRHTSQKSPLRTLLSPVGLGLLFTAVGLVAFRGNLSLSYSALSRYEGRMSTGESQFIGCARQSVEAGDLILAPRLFNWYLFGTIPGAGVFYFLGQNWVSDGSVAIKRFYPSPNLQEPPAILGRDRLDLLDRYRVRFVVLSTPSQLEFEMQQMSWRFVPRCNGGGWLLFEYLPAEGSDPLADGNVALAEGRWEEAIAAYQAAIDSGYGDAQAWLAMGWALQEQGALGLAERAYRQAVQAGPDQAWPWLYLGRFLEAYRSGSGALQAYESAISTSPTLPTAHLAMADLLLDGGQSELADAHLRTAARLSLSDQARVDYWQELQVLADLYADRQLWQQAEQAYGAAIKLADTAEIRLALAKMRDQQGKTELVEREYQKAALLDVWDPTPRMELGQWYEEQERWEEAAQQYRLALVLNYWNTTAHMRLGRIADAQEQYGVAEQEYSLAVTKMARVNPGSVSAHMALGWLLTRQERLEEAIEVYRQVVSISPDNPTMWLRLGRNLKAAGYLAEAVGSLREALRLEPGSKGAEAALRGACREATNQRLAEVLSECNQILAE